MGLFRSDDISKHIADDAGGSATKKQIKKIKDVLDEDEEVFYVTRGSTVDVEGDGSGTSLFGNDRSRKSGTKGFVRAAFTDRRVVVKVPQWLGSDERSIPYQNITSADLDTGLVKKRISLQTAGQTYHIEVDQPGKEECREALRHVRERSAAANQTVAGGSAPDPTEQLQRLKELHDDGVVTDDEFEEKKQNLLDEL